MAQHPFARTGPWHGLIPAVAAIAAAMGARSASGQVSLTISSAGVYLERNFCTQASQAESCGGGACAFAGGAFGPTAFLSGSAAASPVAPCTRWTFYALGPMSGNVTLGQRLHLEYDLTAVFSGSFVRLTTINIGGAHAGTDISSTGAGPAPMSSGIPLTGTVASTGFATIIHADFS